MDSVIRAVVIYLFLLVLFRIGGKRTLAQITTFDLVLTLIISEAIQQAMLDTDQSLTHGLLLVTSLVAIDVAISLVKQRWPSSARLLEGLPLVIVERGDLQQDRMARERVSEEDVIHAARQHHGISRLEDVDYAVLEESGGITVIPRQERKA